MQIVIDVDDDFYARLFSHREDHIADALDALYIIRNGIPLPKGHGRLVDFSEVLIKLMQFYDGDKTIGQCLDEVNTIIEADKGRK